MKFIRTVSPPACRSMCRCKSSALCRGMENAKIVRPGYAIEYDFFDPRDLKPTLESKFIQGAVLCWSD